MGRREASTWYTVYEAYRDSLIVIGSARECSAGLSDPGIAQKLGVDSRTIWTWRQKNNLPPNAKRGRPRKEVA